MDKNTSTRGAQKTKKLHEQRSKERADNIANIKAVYQSEKDGPLLADVLKVSKQFVAYHQKLAQDGQGARKTGYKLEDGTSEVENYFMGSEERLSNLDKAAGLQEIIDYIERQTKVATPTPDAALTAKVADAEA